MCTVNSSVIHNSFFVRYLSPILKHPYFIILAPEIFNMMLQHLERPQRVLGSLIRNFAPMSQYPWYKRASLNVNLSKIF
jgi:hypothetical protein